MSNVDITYTNITVGAAYSRLQASVSAPTISVSAFLDYDTKNRYFSGELFSFADATSLTLQKGLVDTATVSDSIQSIVIEKPTSDSFGFTDVTHIAVTYIRTAADSFAFGDLQTIDIGLNKSDSVAIAEALSKDLSTTENDTALLSEAAAISFSTSPTDSTSVSDVFASTRDYQRAFSDTFTLDDFTNIAAIEKDTTAAKTNVFGFADVQVFTTSKALQDTATVSDLPALGFSKPAQESFSTSDVFQKVTAFSRQFAETQSLSDVASAFVGKAASDSATVIDTLQRTVSYSRAPSDSVTFADLANADVGKGVSDSTTVAEVLQRTVAYSRAFTDSAALSEQIALSPSKALTDSASLAENLQIEAAFARTFADAVSFAEQTVAAFGQNLTDAASITESIDIQMTSVASSVLNAGAFNTVPLNS